MQNNYISKCTILYLEHDSCFESHYSLIFFALDKQNHTTLKVTIH